MPNPSVDSFYHLRGVPLVGLACQGLACFAARADDPDRWARAHAEPRVYCLGQCYQAPADADHDARPHVAVHVPEAVLLENVVRGGARDLATYVAHGGGAALALARELDPERLIDIVERSGLRGRGGAGFPTGRKWRAVAIETAPIKYVVANADEGDPGAFSDRFLMEDDPFRLIEAMVIAARAVGASRGYIYLRAEYPAAARVLSAALDEARAADWLSDAFEIDLVAGEGSYVCGEETSLLNALEGRRPEVRPRPPHITARGLHGAPTLVNNVETLCAVPWIVQHGPERYADLGFNRSRGTKLVSLNSLFRRPGLYEVAFGMPLRQIVDELGGGLRRGSLLGVMVGGPLAGLVPPDLLDVRLGHEELAAIGAAVGHGGVIAFADDTTIAEIAAQVFRFGAFESCGKCTPCHRGAPELARLFAAAATRGRAEDRVSVSAVGAGSADGGSISAVGAGSANAAYDVDGAFDIDSARSADARSFPALVEALAATSLCGHGRGLAEFALSLARHYPEELAACWT